MDEHLTRTLIERARAGDRQAFDDLFSGLSDAVSAAIRRRMGAGLRGRLEPEDVLQETFLRAWRSVSRFRWQGPDSPRLWLEAIARHAVVDAARRTDCRPEFRLEREVVENGVSPSRQLRRGERADRFDRALDSLKTDYRDVIRLARIDGLQIREIADRTGRSESAVKSLLLRATRALRSAFGDTESLSLGGGHDR